MLYALEKFTLALCTEKISGPPSKAGPNYYIPRLINHDGVLYSVLPGRICLMYKKSPLSSYLTHPHVYAPGTCPMLDCIWLPASGQWTWTTGPIVAKF